MTVQATTSVSIAPMFGDVAVTLIKLMGHSGSVPGAILADDVPDALARLRLKAVVEAQLDEPPDATNGPASDGEESEHVSLAHRACP